jgi:hypothetical protein
MNTGLIAVLGKGALGPRTLVWVAAIASPLAPPVFPLHRAVAAPAPAASVPSPAARTCPAFWQLDTGG